MSNSRGLHLRLLLLLCLLLSCHASASASALHVPESQSTNTHNDKHSDVDTATVATASTKEDSSPPPGRYEKILDMCYSYLESNLCEGEKWGLPYHFYRPSQEKYSADQWLWDSGAHMITWSNRNVTNAVLDLRTMLQMQQEDGRIPEEIFWSERTPAQEAEILLQYSNTQFTDITQMPVLPYSLRAIYEHSQDKELVREFLPALIRYFDWWRASRDLGDGLIVAIHNWETGLDASPAYDPAFNVYVTDVNESSWRSMYPKFIELCESYKFLYKWNVTEILGRESAPEHPARVDTWFMMKDMAMNSVYASGWSVLADLALEVGDEIAFKHCQEQFQISSKAIQTLMWDETAQSFQSVYTDTTGKDQFSVANSIQNLFPLLLKDLPTEKVDLIADQLADEEVFNAPFSIPTVAINDPQFCATFDADLMWRGPVWGFTNWFLLEGLGLHGRMALQESILVKWVALVELSGISEHYNPITGEPYGTEGLGMSTLVCDYIYKYGWDQEN